VGSRLGEDLDKGTPLADAFDQMGAISAMGFTMMGVSGVVPRLHRMPSSSTQNTDTMVALPKRRRLDVGHSGPHLAQQ